MLETSRPGSNVDRLSGAFRSPPGAMAGSAWGWQRRRMKPDTVVAVLAGGLWSLPSMQPVLARCKPSVATR